MLTILRKIKHIRQIIKNVCSTINLLLKNHIKNGPLQFTNFEEYGHTKSYCILHSLWIVCGDLHSISKCILNKEHLTKKSSNCGGNHTANYRGIYRCRGPLYKVLASKLLPGIQVRHNQMLNPQILKAKLLKSLTRVQNLVMLRITLSKEVMQSGKR